MFYTLGFAALAAVFIGIPLVMASLAASVIFDKITGKNTTSSVLKGVSFALNVALTPDFLKNEAAKMEAKNQVKVQGVKETELKENGANNRYGSSSESAVNTVNVQTHTEAHGQTAGQPLEAFFNSKGYHSSAGNEVNQNVGAEVQKKAFDAPRMG